MCGFTGFFSKKNLINSAIVKKANKHCKFRGKDSSGIISLNLGELPRGSFLKENKIIDSECYENANLVIAHERLSIINPSNKVSQPLIINDLILSFNGSIYNFKAIRLLLEKNNVKVDGKTDTEVLLKSYIKWGVNCFHLFKGTWSIVIFNSKTNELILSRDRFGEKPLYFTLLNNSIYFSSSLAALSELTNFKKLDFRVAKFFIQYGSTEFKDRTLIKNIYNLQPSHYMMFSGNSTKQKCYWNLYEKKEIHSKTGFNEILNYSVKETLNADVGIASTLSGGLDSSNIYKRALMFKNIPAYTAYTPLIDPKEELNLAKEVAAKNEHKIIEINQLKMKKSFYKLVNKIDIPISLDTIIVDFIVNNNISKDGHRVVLNGHGADELFLGYGTHIYARFLDLLLELKLVYCIKYFLSSKVGYLNFIKSCISILKKLFVFYSFDFFKKIFIDRYSILYLIRIFELKTFPLYSWLQMSDRTSMINNIEPRAPFLNPELVELSLRKNTSLNKLLDTSKPLLREISKDILPEKVINRKTKYGYINTPNSKDGLTDEVIIPTINQYGENLIRALTGYSKKRVINLWLDKKLQNSWRLFSTLYWMKKYNIETK